MINRRTVLGGAIAGFACYPGFAKGAESRPRVVDIPVGGFDKVILPREHGQIVDVKSRVRRRYPSREHCMQMVAYLGRDSALVVYTKDVNANVTDWEIVPGMGVRLHCYGPVPEVVTVKTEPTIDAISAVYRSWAHRQPWVMNRKRPYAGIAGISVASSTDSNIQMRHLERFQATFDGPCVAWFTQWRRYPFDVMYPDYEMGNPEELRRDISLLRRRGVISMPYFNALLWDERNQGFQERGFRAGIRDHTGGLVSYNQTEKFVRVRYACPHFSEWREVLIEAMNHVRDSDGIPAMGVYLDMLLASPPILCWSDQHGHVPGDPCAWQKGVRGILGSAHGVVMAEGCAEIYLDLVDLVLMHHYTDREDCVPLWGAVYGDVCSGVGWRLSSRVEAAEMKAVLERSRQFGVATLATPWMTSMPEHMLLTREVRELLRSERRRHRTAVHSSGPLPT
jgi:hypothetical protein